MKNLFSKPHLFHAAFTIIFSILAIYGFFAAEYAHTSLGRNLSIVALVAALVAALFWWVNRPAK